MIIEFFRRGTGLSSGPIDYFLGKNRDRLGAKLLSGNLEEVAELIDSSPYTKKYTAGCLSFYEDDLKDFIKEEIISSFENALFPCLDSNQYRIIWIEHKDKTNDETGKKRLELNFLIPNVELTTGKRLQPFFAKADLNRINDFKTKINYDFDLFDPDDPINRRSIKVSKYLPRDKKDFIEALNVEVALAVTEGLVHDRDTLKKWLTEIGLEITRITKNQISVRNPNNPSGKPIPLKGEFYEQNFRYSEQSTEFKRAASERYRSTAKIRSDEAYARYCRLHKAKAQENIRRYGTGAKTTKSRFIRDLDKKELLASSVLGKQGHRNGSEFNNQYSENTANLGQRYSRTSRESEHTDTEYEPGLADIRPISLSRSAKKSPRQEISFNQYLFSFDSTYSSYIDYLFNSSQQNYISTNGKHGGENGTNEEKWSNTQSINVWKQQPSMCASKSEYGDIQQQFYDRTGSELSEYAATVIEYYRRSKEVVERKREDTTALLNHYQNAVYHYRGARELYEDFARKTYQYSRKLSKHTRSAFRSEYFESLFSAVEKQLGSTDNQHSERHISSTNTTFSQSGTRQTDKPIKRSIIPQTRIGRTLSRPTSTLDTAALYEALNRLQKAQRLDTDYDSSNFSL